MRKRIRYTTVFLSLIFCIIPIVCILMFHHLNLANTLSRMGSGGFGDEISIVKVEGTIDGAALIRAAEGEKARSALYYDVENDNNGETLRYIYFNKDYVHLPMKSGRFFIRSDFYVGDNTAVVGTGRESSIYTDSHGEKRIMRSGVEYRVIGILGYEEPTLLDNFIFLNLDSLGEVASPLLTMDHLETVNSADPAGDFRSRLSEEDVIARHISGAKSFNDSVMPKVLASRRFAEILVCCAILLVLVSVQWVNSQRMEVAVRTLVGASPIRLAALIAGKSLVIALAAFIAGAASCLIRSPAYIADLVHGYAICGAYIVVILLWSIGSLLRTNIQEALK